MSATFVAVGCYGNSAVDGQAGNAGSAEQAISTSDCQKEALKSPDGKLASGHSCDVASSVLDADMRLVEKYKLSNGRTVSCEITRDIDASKNFTKSVNGYFVAKDGSNKILLPATNAHFPNADGKYNPLSDRVVSFASGNSSGGGELFDGRSKVYECITSCLIKTQQGIERQRCFDACYSF